LNPVYWRLLKMALEELRLIDEQIAQLDREMASLLRPHQDAVERLAEVPGVGVDSAQQIIAEVGPAVATFPSGKCLSSCVGACHGDDESAGVNYRHRSPQGNRHMRRVLNQAANAAVKTKGSIFEMVYRRSVPRLGHNQAIGAIAHRQCRLIWLILHQGVRYEQRGPAVNKQLKQKRTAKTIRQLRRLGYRIEPPNPQPSQAQAQRFSRQAVSDLPQRHLSSFRKHQPILDLTSQDPALRRQIFVSQQEFLIR
jgi:transposase